MFVPSLISDGPKKALFNSVRHDVTRKSASVFVLAERFCRPLIVKISFDHTHWPTTLIIVVGYYYMHANFVVDYSDCSLEGTCVTGECQISFEPPGFECLCHSGNYGPRCELYNPCVLTPCQNGATCHNFTNSTYECQCPQGFEGENCVVPVGPPCLHEEPCLNNGTCSKWDEASEFWLKWLTKLLFSFQGWVWLPPRLPRRPVREFQSLLERPVSQRG